MIPNHEVADNEILYHLGDPLFNPFGEPRYREKEKEKVLEINNIYKKFKYKDDFKNVLIIPSSNDEKGFSQ
jgi:hypothetical protein